MTEDSAESILRESQYLRRGARDYIDAHPSVKLMAYAMVGRRRRGSPATVNGYIQGIKKLGEYLQEPSPERIIERAKAGKLDLITLINREGSGFIDWLFEKDYANKTVHTWVQGVKRWLDLNSVPLEWSKVEMPTTSEVREKDRAPTTEELKKLMGHTTQIKDKVVILLASSSGLRIGTLLSLKWGDVDYLSYPDVIKIKVEREQGRKFGRGNGRDERHFFVTWASSETREALIEYRRYREMRGEVITPDKPLIGNDRDESKPLKLSAFGDRWYRLLKRSGLDERSVNYHKLHFHTLRKYFRSHCIGVEESFREQWMGHKGGYLDESYFRAEENRHLEEYRKAMPGFLLYGDPVTSEVVRGLDRRLAEANRKIVEMEKAKEEAEKERVKQRERDRKEMMEIALGVYRELGALDKLEKEKQ